MRFWLVLLAATLMVASAEAHVPRLDEPGPTWQQALDVGDPVKSWAFYGSLHSDEAAWFRFDIEDPSRLYASALRPAGGAVELEAWLVGPGWADDLPAELSGPEGAGALALGPGGGPSFEPFSATAMDTVLERDGDVPAAGTHYLVVVNRGQGGSFGAAIGHQESFTPWEYITVPWALPTIHAWAGVPAWLVIAAQIAPVAIIAHPRFWPQTAWPERGRRLVGFAAGFLCLGTAATTALLAMRALWLVGWSWGILVTAPFVIGAALAGLWFTFHARDTNRGARVKGALLGGVMLPLWAGLVVAPLLAFAWAAWPPFSQSHHSD